jgi:hypothetical protein
MSGTVAQVYEFMLAQRAAQQRYFGTQVADKVLAYMGSTSLAGSLPSLSAHRLVALERGAGAAGLVVKLVGAPPRPLGAGEIASVCIFNQFVGYQVKTRAGPPPPMETWEGVTTVRGAQVYTLHHSPFMMTAFERVPVEEVLSSVGGATHALCAMGAQVNLSPRFAFHFEVRDGRLVLFHGDGLPLKTYLNLKSNPRVLRVVLDPATFRGFLLEGSVQEFDAAAEPAAHQAICAGFAAGGWGRPARTFRFVAEAIRPLAPVGE